MTEPKKISSAHKKEENKKCAKNSCPYTPHDVIEMPKSLRFRKDMSWGEKCFISEVHSLSDENGCCVFNGKALAELLGISQVTINGWVKKLSEREKIEIGKKRESGVWVQYIKISPDVIARPQ